MSWPTDSGGIGGTSGAAPIVTTWALRPTAANNSNIIRFTDVGGGTGSLGGGNLFFSNGTRWKPVNGTALLDAVDTANVSIANTAEQQLNPNHVVIPAALVGDYDRLRIKMTLTKSGAVDTATVRLRFGPLGTTADPVIAATIVLVGANQSYGALIDFKRTAATTLQKLGNGDISSSFSGLLAAVIAAPVTVSSMTTNPMYLTISSQMTTGTETVSLSDYTLYLNTTDSQ